MAKVTFHGYVLANKTVYKDILITVMVADPTKNLNQFNNGKIRIFHLPAISEESTCSDIYRLAVNTNAICSYRSLVHRQ